MATMTEQDAPSRAAQQQSTEDRTAFGWVRAFTVDDKRLLIKLDCSAIFRVLVAVRADAPNFRTAVSFTMLAYNNKEQLSVRYTPPDPPTHQPLIVWATEVGLGEDAFEIKDWPFKPKL